MNLVNQVASSTYDLSKVDMQANRFEKSAVNQPKSVEEAQELHDTFSNFIGETFYGQMIKSMRSTVDKPAYFHGGKGEEVFQSQLDQQLAQEWAAESGDRFAEPMFKQQFPDHAKVLQEARQAAVAESLDDLNALRRF